MIDAPELTPDTLIARLRLEPLPGGEGGWFRRISEGPEGPGGRRLWSVILALFTRGQGSAPHTVDVGETWTWVAGDVFVLEVGSPAVPHRLGPADTPLVRVPPGVVQGGRVDPAGGCGWSLVACTCRPEFREEGFELV